MTRNRVLLAFALVLHLVLQVQVAWAKIQREKGGEDFSSYYYALQVAKDGGDPYDTDAMTRKSRADHTRTANNPFFYPPPFLLAVSWAAPLSLHDAYVGMLFVNEALLAGVLAVSVVGFGVPVWAVALVLATFSPIPDHAWMGQANLLALFPTLAGIVVARRRPWLGGVLLGIAGMLKMSPALLLLYWAMRRQWRPVVAAAATAVLLSVAALPLVGLPYQLEFYRDVLPGFSTGDYHGLKVPISLAANHSIPDLYDRLFPTPADTLSPTALHASTATIVGLLAFWAWWFRRSTNEAAIVGALTVIMVVTPVYTYEHHLVFLLLAVGAAAAPSPGFVLAYFFLAWPLPWLRWTQAHLPSALGPWVRESKTIAEAAFFLLLCRRR